MHKLGVQRPEMVQALENTSRNVSSSVEYKTSRSRFKFFAFLHCGWAIFGFPPEDVTQSVHRIAHSHTSRPCRTVQALIIAAVAAGERALWWDTEEADGKIETAEFPRFNRTDVHARQSNQILINRFIDFVF